MKNKPIEELIKDDELFLIIGKFNPDVYHFEKFENDVYYFYYRNSKSEKIIKTLSKADFTESIDKYNQHYKNMRGL